MKGMGDLGVGEKGMRGRIWCGCEGYEGRSWCG